MECFVLCNAYKGGVRGERCGMRRFDDKHGKFRSLTCGQKRCLKWKDGFKVLGWCWFRPIVLNNSIVYTNVDNSIVICLRMILYPKRLYYGLLFFESWPTLCRIHCWPKGGMPCD
jgi:hypothetical protein